MTNVSTEPFARLALSRGANAEVAERWSAELVRRYGEPHRRYHTLAHIVDILPLVDSDDATLAAWFHDAIYDTRASDNEAASAALAATALRELRFDEATIARVERMIAATAKHDPAGLDADGLRFLDADLSILGADSARYAEYTRQVREEDAWVPDQLFRTKRREILIAFATRPRIYFTAELRGRFEETARRNLAWEIDALDVSR